MKTSTLTSVLLVAVCGAFFFSCVPARQLEEIKKKKEACETQNGTLKTENQTLTTSNTELQATITIQDKKIAGLVLDSGVTGTSYRTLTTRYDQLNKIYQQLLDKNKELLSGNNTETLKILKELQTTKDSLLTKEDALKKLAAELETKKKNLDALSKELETSKTELDAKSAKLTELQNILNKKDSIVKALKNKVLEALTGYEGKGLTITQKNGKVYVSLEESLIFASGSFTVDAKGVEAIKKLAKVLESNPDINVLIEGHTDNVPYTGTGVLKDNWDLSVLRATAIVKIITTNSDVAPKRLTAAGRSEYDPVGSNETTAGKAKNRRIEIILTPKLDELFQIIETN
ncbi:MAG: OmpA family protein [Bacteroidota bacterium]